MSESNDQSVSFLTFFWLGHFGELSAAPKEPKTQAPVEPFGKMWLFATAANA